MPTISLSQGKVSVVSEEDHEYLSQYKWTYNNGYAMRKTSITLGKRQIVYMHRIIVERMIGGPIPDGYEVDHINGDRSDNQRGNLRLATHVQNVRNKKNNCDSISRYRGVSLFRDTGKWRASIWFDDRAHYLGSFASEEDAACAYDEAAQKVFGEFARLNFPCE